MSKTTILYKDVAPGAIKNVSIEASDPLPLSDVKSLALGVPDVPLITFEKNRWLLNGTYEFVSDGDVAFWSSDMSGDDGVFSEFPTITVKFNNQYSSIGITLAFDQAGEEWCSLVNIKWYQGDFLKSDVDFSPDKAYYLCENVVESYDSLVISLKKTNKPNRRAKLSQILFGTYRYFDMTEIRSASITNETSLVSLEVPVSTMKWDLESRDNLEFMFQLKQPIEVRSDNALIGVYYIDGSRRMGSGYYSVDCYDAIGVLDEYPFSGGVYSKKSAKELLQEIIGSDFEIDFTDVQDKNLTGAIMSGTKRDAIHQVLFAWGVTASTDGTENIRVFSVPSNPKSLGKDQTFTGVSVSTDAIVTEVRVTAHKYTESANGNVEINGIRYTDETTVYSVKNPDVTANDKQNVKEVTGATLVSFEIGQEVAQRVYDYYQRRNTQSANIVWKGELLGDALTIPNTWGSENTGNVEKMQIKLSNTIVAGVESVGV